MTSLEDILVIEEFDFASLPPRFAAFNDYLLGKTAGARLARRADIEPTEIPKLIPWINLLDLTHHQDGSVTYRFRLVGTEFAAAAGRDPTGRDVEEMLDTDYAPAGWDITRRTVALRRPVYGRFKMRDDERHTIISERVQFPLSEDGETVDMIATIHDFLRVRRR